MRFTSERGFTFVEVLVAIFLLSLVTVVIMQIYNSGVFSIMVSGNRTEALYGLQERLESEIINPNFDNSEISGFQFDFDGKKYTVSGRKIRMEETVEGKPVSASVIVSVPAGSYGN